MPWGPAYGRLSFCWPIWLSPFPSSAALYFSTFHLFLQPRPSHSSHLLFFPSVCHFTIGVVLVPIDYFSFLALSKRWVGDQCVRSLHDCLSLEVSAMSIPSGTNTSPPSSRAQQTARVGTSSFSICFTPSRSPIARWKALSSSRSLYAARSLCARHFADPLTFASSTSVVSEIQTRAALKQTGQYG